MKTIEMAKYSKQIVDSISRDLKDSNLQVISIDIENLIMEYLLEKVKLSHEMPPRWRSMSFAPASDVQDTFSVLGYIYPEVSKWSINGVGGGVIEAFIFDKKYSVLAPTPARALLLAIWNYTLLKNAGE